MYKIISHAPLQKHTEGGDFRQACYRAVRQGLMEAQPVLLEPYYDFRLEVPDKMIRRSQIAAFHMHVLFYLIPFHKKAGSMGTEYRFSAPVTEDGMGVLTGYAPVASMRDYPREVAAYTKGHGKLFCTLRGYGLCHNTEEVVAFPLIGIKRFA